MFATIRVTNRGENAISAFRAAFEMGDLLVVLP